MKLKYRVEKLSEDVINTVQLYNILLKEEFSFLLESTEGEEKIGRFSILGARPLFIYRVKGDEFVLRNSLKNTVRKGRFVHPFFLPREVLKEISVKIDLPVPFKGGWVGFLGYECISFFEPVRRSRLNILNMPDQRFIKLDIEGLTIYTWFTPSESAALIGLIIYIFIFTIIAYLIYRFRQIED